ncbi:MAG: hypothetical protein ACK4S3_02535 [Parvibaculum sp.]
MRGDWADNEVYWATLAYARWWLAVDGPFVGAVTAEGGFTKTLLRRVAVRYNVNRGLLQPEGQKDGEDVSASGVIDLLRGATTAWPAGLCERADVCVQIAEAAQQEGWTDKLQVSGVSKFVWFLKPERWTLFDRFAAKGMGVPAHWNRRHQFQAFYATLDDGDFDGVVARIEPVVTASVLPGLPASRIIDSLLMARGARGSTRHEVEESRTFLTLLPPEFRDDLQRVATQLQDEIGNDVLPPMNTKRKKS